MRKKLLMIGFSFIIFFSLAACGSANTGEGEVVRLFVSGDTAEGQAYSKMAEKYKEETGVTVEVSDIPYADIITKISTAVQADEAPDLARVSGIESEWADHLVDLTEVAEKAGTIESMTVKDEDGKVKAIPTDVTAVGMFINKDLFDEAGVSYPMSEEDIWTWDEFLTDVEKVLEKTDAKYGLLMDASDHRLRAFTYQFGGQDFFLNEAGDSYTTDEETKKALEKFISLNDDHIMPKNVWTSGEDPSALFKSGRVAAYLSGSWQIVDFSNNITDFEWASVYMPYEKVRATNMGGNFMVAFDNSKNTDGAREFLNWLYEKENYTQLSEYAGYIPGVEGLEIEYAVGQESYDIYSKEIASSDDIKGRQTANQVSSVMKGFTGLTGEYKNSIVKVLNNEMTLEEAIQATIEDYNNGYLKK